MSEHTSGKICVSSKHPRIIKMHDFMGETDVMVASASGMTNSGFFPTDDEAIANARRLVAAWNACTGMSTEDLEEMRLCSGYAKKIESLIEQRDRLSAINAELLESLKLIAAQDQGCGGNVTEAEAWRAAQSISRAAIAKAQGEQT